MSGKWRISSLGENLREVIRSALFGNYLQRLLRRGLVVGKNFSAQGGVIIDSSHCWHIRIGDDVTLAPRVHILAHDASTKRHLGYTRIGKVTIGNRVFIGASAIVLPGVTIGDGSIIGAGSVITADVPGGVVVAGNPGRVICSVEAFLEKRRSEMKNAPVFGSEYWIENAPTSDMKLEMNRKMKDGFGFIS